MKKRDPGHDKNRRKDNSPASALQQRDAVSALPASLREGARGHPKAEALLRAARARRRAG